jgi:hypothetical protein
MIDGETMNTIDIFTVAPGDIVRRVRNEHRPWTSGSPGCKDCGTNEPCAAQEAANEVLRLSRLINNAADDLSRIQGENIILRELAGLAPNQLLPEMP